MTASIERRRGKLAASMFLRDGDGHGRWFDGFSAYDDCKVLVTAMALSIAVLLDDAAELPAPPGAPAKPASPPAPPSPTRTAPPVRAPPRSRASPVAGERFSWVAGLGAVAGLGMTPGVAGGPALSFGARWPAWSVTLEVRGLASLPKTIDKVPMAVSLLTANAAICHHRQFLFACGLSEARGASCFLRRPLGWSLAAESPGWTWRTDRHRLALCRELLGARIHRRRPDPERYGDRASPNCSWLRARPVERTDRLCSVRARCTREVLSEPVTKQMGREAES